jgi:hypothetical protein
LKCFYTCPLAEIGPRCNNESSCLFDCVRGSVHSILPKTIFTYFVCFVLRAGVSPSQGVY